MRADYTENDTPWLFGPYTNGLGTCQKRLPFLWKWKDPINHGQIW